MDQFFNATGFDQLVIFALSINVVVGLIASMLLLVDNFCNLEDEPVVIDLDRLGAATDY